MAHSITLRSTLQGSLTDLVEGAQLNAPWKCSLICELVSLLADYQEEGKPLFLDAFVTNDLALLTAPVPQSSVLTLGETTCDDIGLRMALKKTAPLVRSCWKMFLTLQQGRVRYGLFRDSGNPLNVPIELALKGTTDSEAQYVRITKLAQDTVMVSTHSAQEIIVHFTNAKPGIASTIASLADLSSLACAGLNNRLRETCQTYLASLLSSAIRESHGALIAVVKSDIPHWLTDCTRLEPPVDIAAAVELAIADPKDFPQLDAIGALVRGMFGSDGIVIIDSAARVRAYNAFVKLEASTAVGGARRRAFNALAGHVGADLVAAFYQSQDGGSEIRR